jgi:hypothetical protein
MIESHNRTGKRNDLTVISAVYYDDLVGPGEIRALAGVGGRTLANWRGGVNLGKRGPFPAPVAELSIGPVWDRRHVRAWLRAPASPRKRRKTAA